MKHSSLCICVGALLVLAPMLFLAYQAHEVVMAARGLSWDSPADSFNLLEAGLAWRLVPWMGGSTLIVYGMVSGVLEFRRNKPSVDAIASDGH